MSVKKILTKLKLYILIIAILPVLIFTIMAYFVNKEAVTRSLRNYENKMAMLHNSSLSLNNEICMQIGKIEEIADSPEFKVADVKKKQLILTSNFSSSPYIQEAKYFDTDRKLIFEVSNSGIQNNQSSTDIDDTWLDNALEGRVAVSDVFFEKEDPLINISLPVLDGIDKSVKGILSVNVSLGNIFQNTIDISNKDEKFVYIIDNKGKVVWATGKLKYLFPKIVPGYQMNGKSPESITRDKKIEVTACADTINIQDSTWQMICFSKKPDYISSTRRLLLNILGAFILVLIFALVLSHYTIKGISAPIEDIAHIAKQIDTESLDKGLPVKESGALSFDDMKQKIQKYMDDNKEIYSKTKQRLEKRVVELRTIHSVTEAFSSINSIPEMLNYIVEQILTVLPTRFCSLYLNNEKGVFKLRALAESEPEKFFRDKLIKVFPINEEPYEEVRTSQKALIVHDASGEDWLPDFISKSDIGAYCVFPLFTGDKILGILEIGLKKEIELSEGSIRLLITLAKEASIAIQNALLYQKMARDKEKVETIFSSISDGVLTMDLNGSITSFNLAAEEITGHKRDQVNGKNCNMIFTEKREADVTIDEEISDQTDESKFFYLLKKAQDQDQFPLHSEHIITTPDGEERTIEVSSTIERHGHDEASAFVSVFRDISRIKELEELRSSFIDTMSHELRTPLTSIKGYVSTLLHPRAKFSEEEIHEFLEIINDETNHLNRMINDLLEASKLQRDSLIIRQQPFLINDSIMELVQRYKSTSLKHNFIMEIEGNPVLYGDPHQLEFVLSHLIENAIKFSPEGGEVKIALLTVKTEKNVTISIEDEGIGVPVEHRERIFDLFHRVDNRSTRRIYGPGMGLYISKKIVEAHNGKIWVESKVTSGSKFIFTIPKYIEPETNKLD